MKGSLIFLSLRSPKVDLIAGRGTFTSSMSSSLSCCLSLSLFLPPLFSLSYFIVYSILGFVSDFKNYSKETQDLHLTFCVAKLPLDMS